MELNPKNTLKLVLLFLIWRHEISAASRSQSRLSHHCRHISEVLMNGMSMDNVFTGLKLG